MLGNGARRDRRRLVRRLDARGVFRHVAGHAELIAQFVQMAEAAIDIALRDLPDEAEHRRVHGIGLQQRRAGIQEARSRHDGERLRLARRQRRAERHVGRRLLMPRVQDRQATGCLRGWNASNSGSLCRPGRP